MSPIVRSLNVMEKSQHKNRVIPILSSKDVFVPTGIHAMTALTSRSVRSKNPNAFDRLSIPAILRAIRPEAKKAIRISSTLIVSRRYRA